MKGKIISIVAVSLVIGGCSSYGPMGPREATGTVVGGVTGAAVGAGVARRAPVVGAAVGAAAGGLVGGAVGRKADEQHHHKVRQYRNH